MSYAGLAPSKACKEVQGADTQSRGLGNRRRGETGSGAIRSPRPRPRGSAGLPGVPQRAARGRFTQTGARARAGGGREVFSLAALLSAPVRPEGDSSSPGGQPRPGRGRTQGPGAPPPLADPRPRNPRAEDGRCPVEPHCAEARPSRGCVARTPRGSQELLRGLAAAAHPSSADPAAWRKLRRRGRRARLHPGPSRLSPILGLVSSHPPVSPPPRRQSLVGSQSNLLAVE